MMAFEQDVRQRHGAESLKKALNDDIYFNKTCQAVVESCMPGGIELRPLSLHNSKVIIDQKCPTGLRNVNNIYTKKAKKAGKK